MNHDTETHYDQTIEFVYEGNDYIWQGDYTVTNWGDDESEFAPAYGETEVSIDHTTSLSYYNEATDLVIEVKPTASILCELSIEIERNL